MPMGAPLQSDINALRKSRYRSIIYYSRTPAGVLEKRMKKIRNLALACASTGLVATAAIAEGEPVYLEVSQSILTVVDALQKEGLVDWVRYGDLDGDGTVEAVVKTMMGPDADDPEFREWRVIDEQDGMGVQLGTWFGTNVEVVLTKPAAIGDTEVSAVLSDGALWYVYQGKVRPFGDMVAERNKFIHPGTAFDTDRFAGFGFDKVDPVHMARLTLDVSDHPGDEVLISLMGDGYWREEDGATPYILLTAAGDTIHSGWSFTHPSVFKLPDGGFQLIESVNLGYRAVYFPEEAVQ